MAVEWECCGSPEHCAFLNGRLKATSESAIEERARGFNAMIRNIARGAFQSRDPQFIDQLSSMLASRCVWLSKAASEAILVVSKENP